VRIRTVLLAPLAVLSALLYYAVYYLPYWFAPAYVGGLATAWTTGSTSWLTGLLWGYGGLAVITWLVMLAFQFRHCCVELATYGHHILREEPLEAPLELVWALVWPVTWILVTRSVAGWMTGWSSIVFEPAEYFIGRRRGKIPAVTTYTTK
jgi:hypothetical protein